MAVKVCDYMMGGGKTSAVIEYMQREQGRYVYVTPYKDEYQRVMEQAPGEFETPYDYPSKLVNIVPLLRDKKNIASTHSLFASYTPEIVDLIKDGEYTLVMDETFEVIHEMNVGKKDMQYLLSCNAISIDPDTHVVRWLDDRYNGEHFNDLRLRADAGTLIYYRDTFLFWMFPIEVFNAFKDVIVLTYLFDASNQRYYFEINNVEYDYISMKHDPDGTAHFCPVRDEDDPDYDPKALITIIDKPKLNAIGTPAGTKPGDKRYMDNKMLSHTYLQKHAKTDKDLFDRIGSAIHNVFHYYCDVNNTKAMWSILEEFKDRVKPHSYISSFVACTMRATNKYKDRTALAYIRNIYMNPFLRQYYQEHGCQVDEDAYALSELLQWVWRSAIRDHKPIVLYLPSSRMRYLFTKWLDDVSNGVEVRKRNPTERITETVNEQPT